MTSSCLPTPGVGPPSDTPANATLLVWISDRRTLKMSLCTSWVYRSWGEEGVPGTAQKPGAAKPLARQGDIPNTGSTNTSKTHQSGHSIEMAGSEPGETGAGVTAAMDFRPPTATSGPAPTDSAAMRRNRVQAPARRVLWAGRGTATSCDHQSSEKQYRGAHGCRWGGGERGRGETTCARTQGGGEGRAG
jgi:hypothetical protein